MSNKQLSAYAKAIREAAAEHDIEALARLNSRLFASLTASFAQVDRALAQELYAALATGVAVCEADKSEVLQKLAALANEREANTAYAVVEQWEHV